ncbi:MAG TPA: hypothetical protein PLX49_10215 [Prolixibacteraceae bacterium]|nr:hypothetical protein [Prolixibacteraceae bacterium]
MKWFKNITTLDELRGEYRRLALSHHPDRGGDTRDMQEINREYDELSKLLINGNATFSQGRKSWEHFVSSEIREKINQVIFLQEVTIEVIGSWIWITGNTRAVKDELKARGFKFSPNKQAWYWQYGDYRKRNGKQFSMEEIRDMWGTREVETRTMNAQLAC